VCQIAVFPVALVMSTVWPLRAEAQQQPQGFAVERFYPSAAGGGWFVMDDLNIDGGFGGALAFTTGYSRKPLEITSADGTRHVSLVSDETFVDVGVAATYSRYRVYLNLPMPLLVIGKSGTVGPYQLSAPAVDVGTNPDTISDARVGFDMRLLGKPESSLRVGVGAQLILPSGTRADYVTDGTSRGMVRFLAAGAVGHFSYAGQLGLHIRPIDDSPAPGSPNGNEFLFGLSAGRRFSVGTGSAVVIGPEVYGETALRSFFGGSTGVEGLLTGRLEGTGDGRRVRLKLGVGGGLNPHFGAPEWRIVFGVELFGHRSDRGSSTASRSRRATED
jgi:hypothetical protein